MPQHTGFACPTCHATGITRPLVTRDSQFGYQCGGGHVFEVDTQNLLAMNLQKIDVPKAPRKPREGLVQYTMAIPGKLIEALRVRFKDRLDVSIESLMIAMLDSSSFIMTGFDVDKLGHAEFLGQRVKSSDQLLGLVYSLRIERNEAVNEAELYKTNAKSSTNGTSVAVNDMAGDFVQVQLRLTIDDFTALKDKAKFNGKPPAQYLSEVLSTALAQGWL